MPDANGLVSAMKRAAKEEREASKPVNVVFGQVISISPLQINVEQQMVLGEKQLVLARNVTDYITQVTVSWNTENRSGGSGESSFSSHNHAITGKKQITVHNGLAVGDEVILVRQQKGQKFIVLDRIGT